MVMPIVPITMDEANTPNADTLDGLRFYNKRLQSGQSSQHQFATTDKTNMHFGHGKFACPGRFRAMNTIKIIVAHMLVNYEFKLPDGSARPANFLAHEYVFPNPEAHVLFKERPTTLI